MFTKLEDLVIELWLEIFPYLKIPDQFNAFFNLNTRLNQILFSYRTQISCKNNDETTEYLFKYILPYLINRKNVSILKLEKTKKIDLMDKIDWFYFPHLTTLILHRLNVTENLLNILQQNKTYLRYLYISPLVSGDKKYLYQLLEIIISLPNLQTCRLRLGIGLCSDLLIMSTISPMKYLQLNGQNEHCRTDRLIDLLEYLPYLQTLHIITNQLNINSTKIFPSNLSVSIFTLNIKQFNIPLIQFLTFISILTPNIQELTIICRSSLEDLSYLNHREWIPFIQLLPNLKQLTLKISHSNTINEQTWTTICQKLTKLMTKNHILLQIIT